MNKFREHKVNFRTLFILGITFTGAGVAMQFYPMMIIGLLLMGIGLFNHDTWSQNDAGDEK